MKYRLAPLVLLLAAVSAAGAAQEDNWLQDRIERAQPGETITLPPGEYAGPLVIDKPLVLQGEGRSAIRGNGRTHVIHIKAADVVIAGFAITGSGLDLSSDHAAVFVEGDRAVIRENEIAESLHGIYLKQVTGCRIVNNRIKGKTERLVPVADVMQQGLAPASAEMCTVTLDQNQRGNGIHLWRSEDNLIEGNVIRDTRDGIYFSFSHHTHVRGNRIHHVRYGLHYMYSDDNVFENNHFTENAAGAAIMYSEGLWVRHNTFTGNRGQRAYGILLQSVDRIQLAENEISRNTVGIYLENSNDNTVKANTIAHNYIGARLTVSSGGNRFSRNRFSGNLHPVEFEQVNQYNTWEIAGVGNYWQGFQPVDLDGNGIGDLPHREVDLFGPMRRDFPLVGLLSGSPAVDLVRFATQQSAIPGLPVVVDKAPLTTPDSKQP